MPLVSESNYRPPWIFRSAHMQTIYPALFRRVGLVTDTRERIQTPDQDFLDLDWKHATESDQLLILSHGLEGNSHQAYIQGMARVFAEAGWNVLAWNYRGCSGELNRRLISYHSGATGELQIVLNHVFEKYAFKQIALIGFSLGGNLTLKYLGDRGDQVDSRIQCAVTFSVPCDLASASLKLESFANRIYMRRFLRTLRKKIRHKMKLFPGQLDDAGLDSMTTFREFDGGFTAPIHGFESAEDYWRRCSSKPVLTRIKIPTLLVNAANDPFLAPDCFPLKAAEQNPYFYLEIPRNGGHVGFISFGHNKTYWSERRALRFVEKGN